MRIRANLPSSYGKLIDIKEENYPFSNMSRAFMRAVIELGEQEGLSHYGVFGRLEMGLPSLDLPRALSTDDAVRVDYEELDPEIVEYYQSSGMSNKQLTVMFLRLMLRMSNEYGNSIPSMIYHIESLSDDDELVNQSNDTNMGVRIRPAVNRDKGTDDDASVNQPNGTNMGVRRRSATNTPSASKDKSRTPAAKEAHKKVSDLTKKVESIKNPKAAEPSEPTTSLDDIISQAEALKATASDVLEGKEVTVNPLLGDFL